MGNNEAWDEGTGPFIATRDALASIVRDGRYRVIRVTAEVTAKIRRKATLTDVLGQPVARGAGSKTDG
jgi:hypothetical protein